MNDLLSKCYKILSLEEGASREHVIRAFEMLKGLFEETAAHPEAEDSPEPWERLKEITWAKDTLLRYRPESSPPPVTDTGREALAAQRKALHGRAIQEDGPSGNAEHVRPWWLSSVAVGIAVVLFSIFVYYYQSRPLSKTPERSGSSLNQASQTGAAAGGNNNTPSADKGDLPQLLQEVKKAVVTLQFGKYIGSGFLVSEDGYIATNAHVVNGLKGSAQFDGGDPVEADLVRMEPEKDFALLKTASGKSHSFLRLADSNSCREGDTVIAVGSPYNLQLSFTKGIISAKGRKDPRLSVSLIQTDAAINHGNSGGPLINQAGEVIGINTQGFQKDMAEGLNFAIAINDVKGLIKEGQALSDTDRTRETPRLEAKLLQQQQRREERTRETNEQIARTQQQEDGRYKDQLDDMKRRLERAQKRQALQTCLVEVNKKVEDLWDDECRSLSRSSRCRLPATVENRLQGTYLSAQSDCLKYYGE
jgi:S1-C subfamily serine protease